MVLATTMFERLAHAVADSFGLPGARIVVVPHPLGGTPEDQVASWADAAVERVTALLTRQEP